MAGDYSFPILIEPGAGEKLMSDEATYELDGHIATITYNRPESLNAINGAMRECLNAAWLEFYNDPEAWVAVLTGAGRAFCAGADLRPGQGNSAGSWSGSYFEIPTVNSFESGLELWKPTIAAVNGACIGYGLTGAIATDFLLASDQAVFGMPEVKVGVPTIVGSMRIPSKVAWADAMEILLTGDNIDAEQAADIGLAWRVFPHDDLMDEMILLCVQSGLKFEKCSSNRRKQYHLVAVLLNNFVNHLVYLSQEEANKRGLSWDVLEPLLEKTFMSLKQAKAKENQTGPARRGDLKILAKHEEMLDESTKKIYHQLSKSILNTYKDEL